VNPKVRAWLLIALVAALCAASIGGVFWYRSRTLSPAAMRKRLPSGDGVVFYIDFEALRRGGLMRLFDNAKSPEDPEYLRFVQDTTFNYKQDLDAVMAAFGPSGRFILAKGRFDWKVLRKYAESQQGKCYNSLCRMNGSAPDRKISFLPIQSGLMALAVSTDEMAAMRLASATSGPDPEIPDAPVWATVPPSLLRSAENLPDGTRPFARAVGQAESVTLAFVPEGYRFALKLTVVCRNDQDAYDATAQLTRITDLLRKMIVLEKQTPRPDDLAAILVSGTFKNAGNRAFGYWPVERVFVEGLLR
jgi:hypothetical protein